MTPAQEAGVFHSRRTSTLSVAPFASMTDTRAKPAPSGVHAD